MKRDWSEFRGVTLAEGRRHPDERGHFMKLHDASDDATRELSATQLCTAFNAKRGTLRGMHFQVTPEIKMVWCSAGEIVDVVVDTRPDEPTYGDWLAVHLRADVPLLLTVPAGMAHGYQTLTDDVCVTYLIKGAFVADAERTLRWDDQTVGIEWPLPVTTISDRDRAGQSWPLS